MFFFKKMFFRVKPLSLWHHKTLANSKVFCITYIWHFSHHAKFWFLVTAIFSEFYETVKNQMMRALRNDTRYSLHLRFLSCFIFDCCLFSRKCAVNISVLKNVFSTIYVLTTKMWYNRNGVFGNKADWNKWRLKRETVFHETLYKLAKLSYLKVNL